MELGPERVVPVYFDHMLLQFHRRKGLFVHSVVPPAERDDVVPHEVGGGDHP